MPARLSSTLSAHLLWEESISKHVPDFAGEFFSREKYKSVPNVIEKLSSNEKMTDAKQMYLQINFANKFMQNLFA